MSKTEGVKVEIKALRAEILELIEANKLLTEIKKDQEKIISISYREYGNKGIQSLKKEVTRLKVYVTDIEKHFNDIERGEEMEVEDMLE